MSFSTILNGLLDAPGAVAAAFLDPQGETVAQAGNTEAVQLLGAYLSVWLGEMARASRRSGLGELAELDLHFRSRRIVSSEVKDGYFVLILLEPNGLVAPVRARLEAARRVFAQEI
jgi:predicted regulator of Ras-like GTPase activity (Roadblock/LC7/MglB family)